MTEQEIVPAGSLLRDWMDQNRMTIEKVAVELDYTAGYVYSLIKGRNAPGRKLAVRIMDMTKGAVSVESWDS